MKIIHDDPALLILENKPVWLALMLSAFGLFFFAIGMSMIAESFSAALLFMVSGLVVGIGCNMAFVRRTQLTLDASQQRVELRRRGWLGDSHLTWDLTYLDRAIVQTSSSGDTDTHRAALVFDGGMDAGTHPVTVVYSSGGGAAAARDAINTWLDSHRRTP